PEVQLLVQSPNFRAWLNADSNGVGRVRLPAGIFSLLAYQYGAWTRNVQVTIEEDKTNHVEVEIPAPVKIAGVVRRADGQPAANLEVRVISSYGLIAENGVTDAAGRFEIEARRAQREMNLNCCVLALDLQNNLAAAVDLEDMTNTLQLALGPALSYVGRVECQGKPVTNHVVALLFWVENNGLRIDGLATNTG
ncbi:MAG TPA: carboxypeptidase-like regulatory domain-containing protein, partial [Verrucomicrobiota bacterium]|nr:carboxypeptidase-like regulatory domain-containing protein [Verrucomicrobiota bacterium]